MNGTKQLHHGQQQRFNMPNTIASTDVGGTGLSTVGTNGQVLTSNGKTLSWQTPAASTTFSAGTTGFAPNTATSGTVTFNQKAHALHSGRALITHNPHLGMKLQHSQNWINKPTKNGNKIIDLVIKLLYTSNITRGYYDYWDCGVHRFG